MAQRISAGHTEARRPPELLTRDHVARKIVKEVKEGDEKKKKTHRTGEGKLTFKLYNVIDGF